jgi:hypothetical protein
MRQLQANADNGWMSYQHLLNSCAVEQVPLILCERLTSSISAEGTYSSAVNGQHTRQDQRGTSRFRLHHVHGGN